VYDKRICQRKGNYTLRALSWEAAILYKSSSSGFLRHEAVVMILGLQLLLPSVNDGIERESARRRWRDVGEWFWAGCGRF
jgi:hypothetical protein